MGLPVYRVLTLRDPCAGLGGCALLLVAYVSSLVLGLASAASVQLPHVAITRTLTGMALAGFTIIVMPLGKARKEWVGPTVKR